MIDRDISGVLVVDKAYGMTSHDVVSKVRRLYGTRKVGHTGTLDPIATGVLVVLIGRAAKLSEILLSDTKKYEAGLLLGRSTDTQDITGQTLFESCNIPDYDDIRRTVEKFVGKIMQTPPMYSAKKIGGKKLYELAREGTTIERKPSEIEVFSADLSPTDVAKNYKLSVCCSKGTYIRTLCNDIGDALGCGGCMSSLRRTRNGAFSIDSAITLDELEKMEQEQRDHILISVEDALSGYEKVHLPAFFAKLARCGCEIYQKKIGTSFPQGSLIRFYDADGFFALGRVEDFEDGSAIKPIKQFC